MNETKPISRCSVSTDDVMSGHEDTLLDHVIKMEEVDLEPDYIKCGTDFDIEITVKDEQTDNCDSIQNRPNNSTYCDTVDFNDDKQTVALFKNDMDIERRRLDANVPTNIGRRKKKSQHDTGHSQICQDNQITEVKLKIGTNGETSANGITNDLNRIHESEADTGVADDVNHTETNNMKFNTKRKRSHKAQIDYLCKYMQQNKEFATGEFKTPQAAADIDRQWIQLQAALDELGPHRTVEQWKICWRDQKRKARVEGSALHKIKNATGNRVAIPELSETTAIILDTIGKEMIVGCGPAESPIGFSPLPSAAPLPYKPPLPATCTIKSATVHPSTPAPHLQSTLSTPPPAPSISAPLPPHLSTQPPAPRPATRRRVRVSHPPDRFLHAQNELNGLIRELTNEVRRSNSLKEEQNRLLKKICRKRR